MTLQRAIETGDVSELPSRRDEDWRWSDLRGLVREIRPPAPLPETGAADVPASPWGRAKWTVNFVNGVSNTKRPLVFDARDPVLGLNILSATDGGAHHGAASIIVPPGETCLLLEFYGGHSPAYVSSFDLTIEVGEAAHLERLVITDDAAGGITVSQAYINLSGHSSFGQTVLATGAKRQRIETHVTHPGQGAAVRMDGAYLVGERRHADLTTIVTHAGPDGSTDQLTKGAVAAQGRGVFQGRIVVERGADKTDAKMGHHALILDDRAEVDAKPELLIFADDVACAHGNTVGQLDEQAIFYAMQRGIPLAQARAMLTEAFVGEVIDRIEHEGARDIARAWAAEKLRGLA